MVGAFDVLGPLRVRIDGVDVTPRAPKERSLLALLATQPGHTVSADRIIDEIWPTLPLEHARRVLWVRVSGLRKLLSKAGAASLLELVAPGYRLAISDEDVDAHRFDGLVTAARRARERGDVAAAAETLRQALDLWRGEPLSDAQGCLALEAEAARLSDARLDGTEDWIDAELASGRHEAVHAEVCRLVAAHPLRERLGRQRAVCLYRAGRQVEALAACHELRRRLADELGLEPGPELQRLEHAILEQSESLAGPQRPVVQEHAEAPAHTMERRHIFHRTPATTATSEDGSGPMHQRAPSPTARPHLRVSAPRAERHNLPAELTRFVGRAVELEQLAELLASFRLVTLTGVGGVGKTRLALAAAVAEADRHQDGVWLIELAPVRADADVAPAFSRALGVMVAADRVADDLARDLQRYLANRRTLLIVDTAEHVIDGVARLVHQLVASCPHLTVLVTSRERLHVRGEAVFAVPPLSLPPRDDRAALFARSETRSAHQDAATSDAVALFCDRARAARPGWTMSADDLAAAAKVCRRVDGLPLAVELAAARVHVLGASQIAERLDDCFALLGADPVTGVPERHQTLRATLDWSHDLLAPAERAAVRRLAVFPGDFDLDAAIAVLEGGELPLTGGDADGFTLVSRLVDKSLVVVAGSGDNVRYRLLDPIRQYATEKLAEAGETAAVRARHRDVYLARHPTMWPLMTSQEREQACADREDLAAALEWSWEQGDVAAALRLVAMLTVSWMWMGNAGEREWLERVVAVPELALDPARARALNELALILHDAGGRAERIDQLMREATAIAVQGGDAQELAAGQLSQVEVVLARGRVDEARSRTQAALRTYERLEAAAGVGWCHHSLGWIAVAEDDLPRARVHFERALDLARSTPGSEWLLPHALASLGPVVARMGEPTDALRLADQAVSSARPFAVRAVLAMALARAAEVGILAGDDAVARKELVELLELLHDLGTRRWVADALEMAAVVLERSGQLAAAAVALGTSAALREAALERGGGVRAVADEVLSSASRLRTALGARDFTTHHERGRSRSPEATMPDMVAALRGVAHVGSQPGPSGVDR